jgi:hypothetical protein
MIAVFIGNQLIALPYFIYNLITKDILIAGAIYGLTTLFVIYPSIIIYFIVKGIQSRRRR